MPSRPGITTFLISDVGRRRQNNEDAVGEVPELGLVVLADGMGGHNAGEVASRIAVDTVCDHVRRRWDALAADRFDPDSGYSPVALLLREAVQAANSAIYQAAQEQPRLAGMGTTIVAALFGGGLMSVAHVGDSRLYRWREGELEQLTRDHSLIEELVARGHYSRQDAAEHVQKNIVTRALGIESSVEVDLLEDPVRLDDIVLLCSDGLSDLVDDAAIAQILDRHQNDLGKAGRALVQLANDAGGRDNISVVLARIDDDGTPRAPWYERLLEWL